MTNQTDTTATRTGEYDHPANQPHLLSNRLTARELFRAKELYEAVVKKLSRVVWESDEWHALHSTCQVIDSAFNELNELQCEARWARINGDEVTRAAIRKQYENRKQALVSYVAEATERHGIETLPEHLEYVGCEGDTRVRDGYRADGTKVVRETAPEYGAAVKISDRKPPTLARRAAARDPRIVEIIEYPDPWLPSSYRFGAPGMRFVYRRRANKTWAHVRTDRIDRKRSGGVGPEWVARSAAGGTLATDSTPTKAVREPTRQYGSGSVVRETNLTHGYATDNEDLYECRFKHYFASAILRERHGGCISEHPVDTLEEATHYVIETPDPVFEDGVYVTFVDLLEPWTLKRQIGRVRAGLEPDFKHQRAVRETAPTYGTGAPGPVSRTYYVDATAAAISGNPYWEHEVERGDASATHIVVDSLDPFGNVTKRTNAPLIPGDELAGCTAARDAFCEMLVEEETNG